MSAQQIREQRNQLILKLLRAGCSVPETAEYLGVAHGTVSRIRNQHRGDPTVPTRTRGRPARDAPEIPKPWAVLGDDYIPSYYTDEQRSKFIDRLEELKARPVKERNWTTVGAPSRDNNGVPYFDTELAKNRRIKGTSDVSVDLPELVTFEPVGTTTAPTAAETIRTRMDEDADDDLIMY